MDRKYVFLTNSSYEGAWEHKKRCMHGFGTYTYPDCSEYRGYFQNGKFHGFGRLKLAAPYKFTVEGIFRNGVLRDIAHMWFHDGLMVKAKVDVNFNLDFSRWKYCKANDRRYVRELVYGFEPVEPNPIITADKQTRQLEKDAYDAEEGIFMPQTGFMTERIAPFKFNRYVSCEDESDWIIENCRRGESGPREPLPRVQRSIIDKHLENENDIRIQLQQRAYREDPCRQYFYRLCERELSEMGAECKLSVPDAVGVPLSSVSSSSSLSAGEPKQDIEKPCYEIGDSSEHMPEVQEEESKTVMMRRNTFEKQGIVSLHGAVAKNSDK